LVVVIVLSERHFFLPSFDGAASVMRRQQRPASCGCQTLYEYNRDRPLA